MEFQPYLDALAATARTAPDVVGLAAFGSTADRTRTDEWSDHDIAWITVPGVEERYRHSTDWLPFPDRIRLHVVEHHGGVKVVYDDGHLVEFGVTDLEGLVGWEMNHAVALVDAGGLAEVLARRAAAPRRPVDPEAEFALAAAALLVGTGRARRGEVLSAGSSVRGAAVEHLLRGLGARSPEAHPPLDALDPHRRMEAVHPGLAAEIAAALEHPVEDAARALLALLERVADPSGQVPGTALAVRRRLGWS